MIRTPSGLSNLRLFHDVDVVIYVEGGKKSLSVKEIEAGESFTDSIDIKFWERLFAFFAPSRKCHFKAIGSKSAIVPIANEIAAGRVMHSVACMDRDHDEACGKIQNHSNVLYTWGYSWENDAWSFEPMARLFEVLCLDSSKRPRALQELKDRLDQYETELRGIVRIDVLLALNNEKLIPRAELSKITVAANSTAPEISKNLIRKSLRTLRGRTPRLTCPAGTRITPDGLRDCYGHLFGTLAYHLFSFVSWKHAGIQRLPYDTAALLVIAQLQSAEAFSPIRFSHYARSFSAIVW